MSVDFAERASCRSFGSATVEAANALSSCWIFSSNMPDLPVGESPTMISLCRCVAEVNEDEMSERDSISFFNVSGLG